MHPGCVKVPALKYLNLSSEEDINTYKTCNILHICTTLYIKALPASVATDN